MKLADYLLQEPLYAYGTQVRQQGTQSTPVMSWQEGLARALQGGVGGFFQGQAIQNAKADRTADNQALADALGKFQSGDLGGATQILGARPNLSDTAAALGMQAGMLGYKQKLENDQQAADMQRFGFGTPTTAAASSAPQPSGGAPSPNNIGNVRPVGQSTGFQQPPDFNSGVQLAVNNAKAYPAAFNNGQPMTLLQIGQHWAPKGDGANDPVQWAKNVAAISGLPPDQPLDLNNPQVATAFARGVHGAEKGAAAVQPAPVYSAALAGQPGIQQPNGDTVNFQGIQLPRAALAGALMIRDHAERQKAIATVVNNAVKFQQEGAPVERVRQPDGSEIIVPRPQVGGMTSAQNVPPPGSKEGDVDVLMRGDPNSPEYAQAYNRQAQPTQSQGGQLVYPNMGAYRAPGGQQPAQNGVQIKDTPMSQFQMSGKLRDDFEGLKPVKDYREVVPIYQSMQDAVGRNNKAADLNLVYGFAKIMDPGSVVREGEIQMAKGVQSLPDWVRSNISAMVGGQSALSPQARQFLMQEAGSRMQASKSQFDALAQQYGDKSQRYGLDPRDVISTPQTPGNGQPGTPAGDIPVYDLNGKRVR